MHDVVSARCCRLASKPQEDCYLCPIGLTTAVGPELVCVDVQLECGEWQASLQTDKLAVAAAAA